MRSQGLTGLDEGSQSLYTYACAAAIPDSNSNTAKNTHPRLHAAQLRTHTDLSVMQLRTHTDLFVMQLRTHTKLSVMLWHILTLSVHLQ